MSSMDDLSRVDSGYKIMTININGPKSGTPSERRKMASNIFGDELPSVICCQELPGTQIFEKEVVNKCGKGDYKCVRNGTEAAVMWRTQHFNGKALEPSDTSITKVIDRLVQTISHIDVSEVRGRTAMVELQSQGEACKCPAPFLAVSWHGPFSKMRLDARKKAFDGLICFLQELCKEKNIFSFIIGGDFNLNTKEDLKDEDLKALNVSRLAYELSSRGKLAMKKNGRGHPYIPYKDNFFVYHMSGHIIKVSSVMPIELDSSKQDLFDHDPIIGVLRLHQKGKTESTKSRNVDQNVSSKGHPIRTGVRFYHIQGDVYMWVFRTFSCQSNIYERRFNSHACELICNEVYYRILNSDIQPPSGMVLSREWSDLLLSCMRSGNELYSAWYFAAMPLPGLSFKKARDLPIMFTTENLPDLLDQMLKRAKRDDACCHGLFTYGNKTIFFLLSPDGSIMVIDSHSHPNHAPYGAAIILAESLSADFISSLKKITDMSDFDIKGVVDVVPFTPWCVW